MINFVKLSQRVHNLKFIKSNSSKRFILHILSNSPMEEKQKKIAQLRTLLGQAKSKIDNLKIALGEKVLIYKLAQDKQIEQVRLDYQKKIKNLQQDQGQIMKQYQQRLIRIQKSLQDSDNLVSKHQNISQQNSKNYQVIMNCITNVANLIAKNFAPSINKQNNEAVEQLCSIQKCKDFQERLQKIQLQVPDLSQLVKSIRKISAFYEQSIRKRRESRLLFIKKQANFQKKFEQQQKQYASGNNEIERLNLQMKNMQQKYDKKIQTIAKSKAKVSEQKTNIQFIKQLFIKVISGPKQASLMAFEVLTKVLKFTGDQHITCQKRLK